jgi:protein-tyrosine-phosphatase
MTDVTSNVLFLCTGNSARSILAEALINRDGEGRYRGFSAGSCPSGAVHPLAIETLQQHGFPIDGLRSKSWHELSADNAPVMNFIFTVCDNANAESCPIWPGEPVSAHWGIADPAAVRGDRVTRLAAFEYAFEQLERRIRSFLALQPDKLSGRALKGALNEIGWLDQKERPA